MFVKFFFYVYLFSLIPNALFGQWQLADDKEIIPFEFTHNLIIINAKVNDKELKFILDTGSERNLLFSIPEKDSIDFYNVKEIKLKGVTENEPIIGMYSENNRIQIGNYQNLNFKTLIVLDNNINLVNKIGVPVNGVLGSDFFKNHLVEIDYSKKKIIVYDKKDQSNLSLLKKYNTKTIKLVNGKPYLNCTIGLSKNENYNLMLLMDTGLGDGLWLFENDSIKSNSNFFFDILGRGLGGDIQGKKSRIDYLNIDDFKLPQAIVSYPDSTAVKMLELVKGRSGSLGGEVLKRFNWFIDYSNQLVYFQKNKNYTVPFSYNMAGVEFQHAGSQLIEKDDNKTPYNFRITSSDDFVYLESLKRVKNNMQLKPIFEIYAIRKNSIADRVGLKIGDLLVSINKQKAYNLDIQKITDLFQSEEGKYITIEVNRKGKLLKFKFQLEKVL